MIIDKSSSLTEQEYQDHVEPLEKEIRRLTTALREIERVAETRRVVSIARSALRRSEDD